MVEPASSKRLKLKEWLTLHEAARYLSGVLGYEANEVDILRFALDGHLKISVYFAAPSVVRCGKIVGIEDVEWGEIPADLSKGKLSHYIMSFKINDKHYINFDEEVMKVQGVLDLPMIGSERLDVEHMMLSKCGGSGVTYPDMIGAFVEGSDGEVYQLQTRHDGFTNYFPAILKISWNNADESGVFCPARLPEHEILVVRKKALMAFEQNNAEPDILIADKKPDNNPTDGSIAKSSYIERSNDFNVCIEEVIDDFIDVNGYPPTADEIIKRMKHRPPNGTICDFNKEGVRINNGTKVRSIESLKRSIKATQLKMYSKTKSD